MRAGTTLVAEVGSVHDGSFGNAVRLIDAAKGAGAHVVKFQTHIAAAETTRDAPSPAYFTAEPRYDYFERTGFAKEQWQELAAHAKSEDIDFVSSPFSEEAVDLLEDVGLAAYKIASGEVSNTPLLKRVAETGRPVWLSSGMSSWDELDVAVEVLSAGGPLTVLQCSSRYPCPPEHVGLNVIPEMAARYGVPVGFSDHTLGNAAATAAVALGATLVEKHLTFSRLMYGSDAALATEPAEFAALAASIRQIDKMLANPVQKDDIEDYREMRRIYQKSLVMKRPGTAGQVLTRGDLAVKKPGHGLPAAALESTVGRTLTRDLPQDHLLSTDDLL